MRGCPDGCGERVLVTTVDDWRWELGVALTYLARQDVESRHVDCVGLSKQRDQAVVLIRGYCCW